MDKIQELEKKLNSLHLLRQNKDNTSIVDILDKNIDEVEKELKVEKSKRRYSTEKELRIKLSQLTEKKQKATLNNDLGNYRLLTKEIREIRAKLKEMEGDIKFLTTNQINSILKAIQKHSKNILRDKLIVLLGFELGLRASEILDLKVTDVYLDTGEILCRRLKGSTQSKIEIDTQTMDLLRKYMTQEQPNEILFSNVKGEKMTLQGLNHIFKRYCELARIPKEKAHYHILKHSRGVWLAENGFTIQAIQFLLGHKSVRNTMIYARFSSSQKLDIYTQLRNTPRNIRV